MCVCARICFCVCPRACVFLSVKTITSSFIFNTYLKCVTRASPLSVPVVHQGLAWLWEWAQSQSSESYVLWGLKWIEAGLMGMEDSLHTKYRFGPVLNSENKTLVSSTTSYSSGSWYSTWHSGRMCRPNSCCSLSLSWMTIGKENAQ